MVLLLLLAYLFHSITYGSPHSNAEKVNKSDRIQSLKSTYFLTLKLIALALQAKLFM